MLQIHEGSEASQLSARNLSARSIRKLVCMTFALLDLAVVDKRVNWAMPAVFVQCRALPVCEQVQCSQRLIKVSAPHTLQGHASAVYVLVCPATLSVGEDLRRVCELPFPYCVLGESVLIYWVICSLRERVLTLKHWLWACTGLKNYLLGLGQAGAGMNQAGSV